MVNALDKAMGIVERTSAELGVGAWYAGMQTARGFLWAATVEGDKYIAFEVAPGQVVVGMTAETLKYARKVASGLNIIVNASVTDDNGELTHLTFIGPRGRVKKIFAFLGWNL